MNSATLLTHCGLSYRQLDYACRKGWLKPDNPHGKGTDNGREWTNQEATVVMLASRLSGVGFPLQKAVELARIIAAMEVGNDSAMIYLGSGIHLIMARK